MLGPANDNDHPSPPGHFSKFPHPTKLSASPGPCFFACDLQHPTLQPLAADIRTSVLSTTPSAAQLSIDTAFRLLFSWLARRRILTATPRPSISSFRALGPAPFPGRLHTPPARPVPAPDHFVSPARPGPGRSHRQTPSHRRDHDSCATDVQSIQYQRARRPDPSVRSRVSRLGGPGIACLVSPFPTAVYHLSSCARPKPTPLRT